MGLLQIINSKIQKTFNGNQRTRNLMIGRALDYALETIAGVSSLKEREPTIEDARSAVLASSTACGRVARCAEGYLIDQGVYGVVFHSLTGHYVILDTHTGLLHDLECYAGCASKESIPIWKRDMEISSRGGFPEVYDKVKEQYAQKWLIQRELFLDSMT